MSLADLFPDEDYRLRLTLRRGEPREFFRPLDESGAVLRERERWLAEAPTHYAALTPEGEPLVAEFAEVAAGWVNFSRGNMASEALTALGRAFEPDILFLSADDDGAFRLRGGVLCFPTGWALEEKLGQSLDFIHGVVPGLNAALASPISQFLGKLRTGPAFLRDNWGIATSDELNAHPRRGFPPPAPPVRLDRLWLRIERQALFALPVSRGVVFGIRIELVRLDTVAADANASAGLRRALATMPADLARYKRLDSIVGELVEQLS